jgi:hypothetical protein
MKKSLLPLASFLTLATFSASSHAATYLNEDFSTYADGDLVGQNGWTLFGTPTTNPIQISDGNLVMSGNTIDNQDAQKPFTYTSSPGAKIFFGYQLQVTGPGVNKTGFNSSYFTGLRDGSFVDTRVAFLNIDGATYQVSARVNGEVANPFSSASEVLSFGSDTISIILGFTYADGVSLTADTLSLWVNPTSTADAPDLTLTNSGTAISSSFSALVLSQYSFTSDVAISKLAVADSLSEVFSVVAVPEPGTVALLALGAGAALLAWRRSARRA